MKFLYKLALLLILFNLQSCSNNEKEISLIKEVDQELEMQESYKDAMNNLNKGDNYYGRIINVFYLILSNLAQQSSSVEAVESVAGGGGF